MIALEVARGIQSELSKCNSGRGQETGRVSLFMLLGPNISCSASHHFKPNTLGTFRDHCRSILVSQMLPELSFDLPPTTPTTSYMPEMESEDCDKVISWL